MMVSPAKVAEDYVAQGVAVDEAAAPQFALVCGPVASGKSRFRREKYATGYVVVDAAAIFVSLAPDEVLDFPQALENELEEAGQAIASRAIAERRNIVTEIIGASLETLERIADAMRAVGYKVSADCISNDLDLALSNNVN